MQPGEASPSPEFELVLAAVRWPLEPADAAHIRKLAQRPLRWPHLLKIARHHQVSSLVARNLESCAGDCIPREPLSSLRSDAMENARLCFQGISELTRLFRLFRQEGIDLLVLKGAPLALYAFQDATLRGPGDIDLLIRPADIPRADALLRSQGYLREEPEPWTTARRMRSYLAHQKDFSYTHAATGGALDLHWRLFRNPWLPSNAGLEGAREVWVQIGPERFPTLPTDRLFLYLCVHGALDGWLRLKWLADIGALLRGSSKEQLRQMAQAACEGQILPEFSAAILLCRQKLGFDPFPPECLSACLGPETPSVARILRFANRLMAANDYCPERERIPSTAWFLNEFLLHPSWRYRMEMVERSLFRRRVWQRISLPDELFIFYALLSPGEWLLFRAERLGRSLLRRMEKPKAAVNGRIFPRFLSLSVRDIALLAEAGILLVFFRVALKFVPVERLTAWMRKGERNRRKGAASWKTVPTAESMETGIETIADVPNRRRIRTIQRVEWAVGAMVRHAPLTFVCFPQSFAAYFMLRRRHIPSRLFYGVAREKQQLKAHTWIKVGDRTVVGGDAESEFTVLAIFP